ncbi:MAG: hypothetical protein A2V89_00200 [Gammaproteobacteria bacterium RBG_16_37_9]|nr:MAG: hypothetical protein A2V89_00200 [Gammaproteobacteria bacterium RBG_16_37_9]
MKKNNQYNATLLKDYTLPAFLIDSARLQFILDPRETIVKAQLHIRRNPLVKIEDQSIKLNGIKLHLQEIKLKFIPCGLPRDKAMGDYQGGEAQLSPLGEPGVHTPGEVKKLIKKLLSSNDYQITPEYLTILEAPNEFILETTVKIHPDQNFACTGLYLTDNNFCTQNEPHGFRAITYFIDRPDILTKFTTTIIADQSKYPVLLSNGNLINQEKLTNNLHQVIWEDPFPKSSYLFALVAGNFSWIEDFHTTKSGRKITLRIFTEPKQLDQCNYAMLFLKQAMSWEEENFGLEYDLDLYQIVAINDLNFGAMENKGLNIFNSKLLLASQFTATDDDIKRIAAVVAHEYFHNWTGNRITCRNWFQIGLKEGLTTLREQLFMEDLYGQAVNRISSIKTICTEQFTEDSGPLAHPVCLQSYIEVDNFYTCTVYHKSAEIARMLITIFGKKTFQQIMQKFLSKFDGQAVTIEDFLQTASDITHTNLEQFKRWYYQAGTPKLIITDSFDNKTYTLKIEQKHQKSTETFYIPLALALINSDGGNTPTEVLIINKNKQSFVFKNIAAKPCPSLLRNFSAPVKVQYSYSDDELLLRTRYDQDPINRWEASQNIMTNIIAKLCDNRHKQQECILPIILIEMFKAIITDKKIDMSLAARMLQLPTEARLLEILPKVDIENIHFVCEFIKTKLALNLKNELLECYRSNHTNKTYIFEATAISKREFKNLALYYLMHLNTPEVYAICCQQLEQADNLTDIYASLTALVNSNYDKREQVLEDYYQKWHDQPNLVNKWLMINACIKSPGNMQRIQRLLNHPGFNYKNPNKVFALIRIFCENNLINFHALNGEGYKFLADQIIIIDKFNPQLAALITSPLTHGHKLGKVRQQLLQEQLIRINQEPGLSKNVYEITDKAIVH